MKHKVKLSLFQDDATGDYGLAHSNAIDVESPFNAFWSHQGIFHDVFEHYFEDVHKYFRGDYAFNIGGEVAAMGHYAYYMNHFYPSDRNFSVFNYRPIHELVIGGTVGEMEDAILCGHSNFGSTLECRVPKQKSNYFMDDIIYDHHLQVKQMRPNKYNEHEYEPKEFGILYKKSVTLQKLRNLYTWGYKQAEKIAPRNPQNKEAIEGFLSFWKEVTENNKAEDLYNWSFRHIEFTIYRGENLKWKAEWILQDGTRIKATKYLEDAFYETQLNSEYDY